MTNETCVRLRPVVRFREFPFGTPADPSMAEAMSERPWENQDRVLEYLRSGRILAVTVGADLPDWFNRSRKANPVINGRVEGGATPMGDGVWFWYAGLIHFVENYNVRLPKEFIRHAAGHNWRADGSPAEGGRFVFSYFPEQA